MKSKNKDYTVDLTKLKKGLIFKNHKCLCECMGWDYSKSATSRKAQLNSLALACKWHKSKNAYVIDEVYSELKEKPIQVRNTIKKTITLVAGYGFMRILVNNMNQKDINTMREIQSNNSNKVYSRHYSLSALMNSLGLTNKYYHKAKYYRDLIKDVQEINLEIINDTFNLTHDKLRDIVESTLDELTNKNLITYQAIKQVHLHTGDEIYTTQNQNEFIIMCEREVMEMWGIQEYYQIYAMSEKRIKVFYTTVCHLIGEKAKQSDDKEIQLLKDIKYYCKMYEVCLIPHNIKRDLSQLSEDYSDAVEELQLALKQLDFYCEINTIENTKKYVNQLLVETLHNDVDKRHERAVNGIRSEQNYVSDSKVLINNYISYDKVDNPTVNQIMSSIDLIKRQEYSNPSSKVKPYYPKRLGRKLRKVY